MKCPLCTVDLVMADRQGIEIDYCPKCRGIWLDRGEIDKIIERSQALEARAVQPPAPTPAPEVRPTAQPMAPPMAQQGGFAPTPQAYAPPPQAGFAAPQQGGYPQAQPGGYPPAQQGGYPQAQQGWKRDDDDDDDDHRRRHGQQGKKRKGFLSELLDFD